MKAIKIEVYGRVQGVYFRANTLNKAKEFSIVGNVKNTPNGQVLILAEGEEKDLEKFIDWCKKGPMLAHVTKVEVSECELTGFTSFEILK
jgi:acylphosphatase